MPETPAANTSSDAGAPPPSRARRDARSTGHPWRLGRFPALMPRRVEEILLVSSPYDSFILEEDGLLTELIYSEYADLGLTHAPNVTRVPTAGEALALLREQSFDLVIAMSRLGDMQVADFRAALQNFSPQTPVAALVSSEVELQRLLEQHPTFEAQDVYVWHGDAKLFVAIVKSFEDRWNVRHDAEAAGVGVIILVEDSVQFRSALLPIMYSELVKQSRAVLADGINRMHKQLRMRARPKILVADTYERGLEYYEKYHKHLFGVIADVRFPRGGHSDPQAGIDFIRRVKSDYPDIPTLLQSSDGDNRALAEAIGASFLNKRSPTLLQEISRYMLSRFGFGDFVFRLPDGREVGRAGDLRSMVEVLERVPLRSIEYHASRNQFSNWLRARTEFELAAQLRPRRVSEYEDIEELRRQLIVACREAMHRNRRGVIEDFARDRFDTSARFVRIGSGSLGGKARGLAFVDAYIARHGVDTSFAGVRVFVPRTVAVGTDVFDEFIDNNRLDRVIHSGASDGELRSAFLRAELPKRILKDLRVFLQYVRTPIAVRSSSLLEDSQYYPFAGIYDTYMLPNNHAYNRTRLARLSDAVKLVYASTFFAEARRYMDNTPYRIEEQKMAVVLQPVIGKRRGQHYYPSFAGTARSFNYYPFGHQRAEDGIATVALGMGSIVVDGGAGLRFSPGHPQVLPQLGDPEQFLNDSQRRFRAIDLKGADPGPAASTYRNTVELELEVAEQHGVLDALGSVWSPENEAFYDGVRRAGVRAVTFAHVLKSEVFPLAAILRRLLAIGQSGMNAPVDIEFAATLDTEPREFAVLQIRPYFAGGGEDDTVTTGDLPAEALLCQTPQAMGHGIIDDLRDVIYVRPEQFDAGRTEDIAYEIGAVNEELVSSGVHSLLIGPGRWGSSNRWLGIPVAWSQISSARIIVEACLDDFVVDPSQGSHFFHNLTAFQIAYLAINPRAGSGFIDWAWLEAQPALYEAEFVRHVRLPHPLEARLNGRTSEAVILKHSRRVARG